MADAPTAQEAFDALIRDHLAPPLKQLGFKRTRATFQRSKGPDWEVINVQRSQFSSAESIRLTINLGTGLEVLRGAGWSNWADGKAPLEYQCHFRERLGTTMTGRDNWWELTPDTDISMLGDALLTAIRNFGLPWLEEHSDVERIREVVLGDLVKADSRNIGVVRRLLSVVGPAEHEAAVAAEIERRDAT